MVNDKRNSRWKFMETTFIQINVFIWHAWGQIILPKDNLAKRNFHVSKNEMLCDKDKTILHLFIYALLDSFCLKIG
jgi:hypothetical protein